MSKQDCEHHQAGFVADLEGGLPEGQARSLQEHLDACGACREEYDSFRAIAADLEAIGDAWRAGVPQVDLSQSIMAKISRIGAEASPKGDILPFKSGENKTRAEREVRAVRERSQSRMHVPGPSVWLAAAAMILIALGLFLLSLPDSAPVSSLVASHSESSGFQGGSTPVPSRNGPSASHDQGQQPNLVSSGGGSVLANDTPEAPLMARTSLALRDILELRVRAIAHDPEAQSQLQRLASLTTQEAQAIVDDPDASLSAKIGAASALDLAQAEAVLLGAIEERPADPSLRHQLAQVYSQDESLLNKADEQLQAWCSLEEDNALARYHLAENQFEQGDLEGAAQALQEAQDLAGADVHTSLASQRKSDALEAAGESAESSRLLGALSAGADEYSGLCELGDSLLQQGEFYESQGELEVAKDVYEGVYDMGSKVEDNATYSNETLAGLDLQRAAIEVLEPLYQELGLDEGLADLASCLEGLTGSLTDMAAFFEGLTEYLLSVPEDALGGDIAASILEEGDLALSPAAY